MRNGIPAALTARRPAAACTAPMAGAQDEIKRMPDGRPDLHGNYDAATLTPLQRPEEYGENLYLSKEEAEQIEVDAAKRRADRHQVSNPDREPPPVGGDGSGGGRRQRRRLQLLLARHRHRGLLGGRQVPHVDHRRPAERAHAGDDPRGQGRDGPRATSCAGRTTAPPGGSTSTAPAPTTAPNRCRSRSAASSASPAPRRPFRARTTTTSGWSRPKTTS